VEAVLATLQSVALLARLQVMLKAGSAHGRPQRPRGLMTHGTARSSETHLWDSLSGVVCNDSAGTDEDILAFDVPDDALEHAVGVTNGRVVTIAFCTHWYHCGLPL
jgi:hypothetical protein